MRSASRLDNRPLLARNYSEGAPEFSSDPILNHARRKSSYYSTTGRKYSHLRRHAGRKSVDLTSATRIRLDGSTDGTTLYAVPELNEDGHAQSPEDTSTMSMLNPPLIPTDLDDNDSHHDSQFEVAIFDFTKIDYELDRARILGRGLWSSVYLAQPVVQSPKQNGFSIPRRPTTPTAQTTNPPCRVYAVKMPARVDANVIFCQEAKILTKLQQSQEAQDFIVSFQGLDLRNSSLIFEGVIGGSLEHLVGRLKVVTEVERHLALRSLFSKFAYELVSGLRFIHEAGVVHADIKPANVLLDVADNYPLPGPVIRARYIDFSASFIAGLDSGSNAAGTWDFMAPEQLRLQKDLNVPTFASDVWSLGLTLLFILGGGSPYTEACGDNVFRLREAIKTGDPLAFARRDPVVQKRLSACQDFVDVCRLALQKDRGRRASAAVWQLWLEDHHVED